MISDLIVDRSIKSTIFVHYYALKTAFSMLLQRYLCK